MSNYIQSIPRHYGIHVGGSLFSADSLHKASIICCLSELNVPNAALNTFV